MATVAVCQFVAVSAGFVDYVVSAAVAGKKTPVQAGAVDGNVYEYYSSVGDQYERGTGTWNLAGNKLIRTTVKDNSLGTAAKISFTSPPTVEVFPTASQTLEAGAAFGATTAMLFQQTAAPLGWTKQTTHNDKALRVVSGTASSGGSNSFSSVMAQTTVGGHTDSVGEMPSHGHGYAAPSTTTGGGGGCGAAPSSAGATTASTGGGGSHNHTILMAVQYVDMIIATKD